MEPTQRPRRPLATQDVATKDISLEPDPIGIIHRICCLAGSTSFLEDIHAENHSLAAAIDARDTPALFDWLIDVLSYQGISDEVARSYIAHHGQVTWRRIERGLAASPHCPRLHSYWHFYDCRFDKRSQTCAEPEHIGSCPLPYHHLRNGRLNQMAYSLYLFVRDVADHDLVSWVNAQLDAADNGHAIGRLTQMRAAVIDPLRHVYGVSDKVLNMAMSAMMLGSKDRRWIEVGGSMIAIDTLVHNFLYRTGILQRWGKPHGYGAGCYRLGGCANVVRRAAGLIEAGDFNPAFPPNFPRFVQHAIWRFCAQQGLNICNGNRIDDRGPCDNAFCPIRGICGRVPLSNAAPSVRSRGYR